jgi:hypothetical protein
MDEPHRPDRRTLPLCTACHECGGMGVRRVLRFALLDGRCGTTEMMLTCPECEASGAIVGLERVLWIKDSSCGKRLRCLIVMI